MVRATSDPFYRQIVARLGEKLDPDAFEDCVCDLLREDYPTLVPVRGGQDLGMDGAIADSEGEAFPLVCTTAEDGIGNLSRSRDSYLGKQFPRRKAVFATSRYLTPVKRKNLEDRAREKEFELVQIFDQAAIADRLYRNPRWCHELLGLSGTPLALSILPKGRRPSIETDPVGREADLEWLRTTTGDRLVIGEPGSGKTFLLEHLVRQGWGLFLVDKDQTRISEAVREQNPEIIVVDDAHVGPDRLVELSYLRQQIGADFSIVATSWIGNCDQVAESLGTLPSSKIRRLGLLSRDYIADILRLAGVKAHPDVIRRLVDQSRNKPGLAATLARLWLRGDWEKVLNGQALLRSLNPFLKATGDGTSQVLAAFGLGGDRGLKMEVASEFLNLPLAQVQSKLLTLRDGGILAEEGENAVAVWPRELRAALIGKIFFSGMGLPYRELLDRVEAPFRGKAVENLVIARLLGVDVPLNDLRKLVAHSDSRGAWGYFTQIGEEETAWSLDHYPGDLLDIAGPALETSPDRTIPRLLQRDTEEDNSLAGLNRVSSLRLLVEWCRKLSLQMPVRLDRRWLLARSASTFLRQGGHCGVGVQALAMALGPELGETNMDPGSGMKLTIGRGRAPFGELSEIEAIWKRYGGDIQQIDAQAWGALTGILRSWSFPNEHYEKNVAQFMKGLASRMLHDLARSFQGSPAAATAIRKLAALFDLEISVEPHPTFELLYAHSSYHPIYRPDSDHRHDLEELARQWGCEPAEDVARSLHDYASEAARFGFRTTASLEDLLNHLAAQASRPEAWVDAFLDLGTGPGFVAPFLKRSVEMARPDWEKRAERCLDSREYWQPAVALLLQMTEMSAALMETVLKRAEHFPELVNTLSLRNQVPSDILVRLFKHPDPKTAFAAAAGAWRAQPEISQELQPHWREAVLVATSENVRGDVSFSHDLRKMLQSDSVLAFDWLCARLHADEISFGSTDAAYHQALAILDHDQRARLLSEIAKTPTHHLIFSHWLISGLVVQNEALFEKLLASDRLRRVHLFPLSDAPEDCRNSFALKALEAGHKPQEVAQGFKPQGVPQEASFWEKLRDGFERLGEHPNRELQEVARHGRQIVESHLEEQRRRERQVELEGLQEMHRATEIDTIEPRPAPPGRRA